MSTANFFPMRGFPLHAFFSDSDEYDREADYEYVWESVGAALRVANDELAYHELSLKAGYFDGVQLYVSELYNPNRLDNDACRYLFDMCRSRAIRAHEREKRRITRILGQLGRAYGFIELRITARFSNGEVWYERVTA